MLGGGRDDPGFLEPLRGKRDQAIHVSCRVLLPAWIVVANLTVSFPGLWEAIQGHAHTDESAVRLLAPPVGLDPSPRFVDRIQGPRVAWGPGARTEPSCPPRWKALGNTSATAER